MQLELIRLSLLERAQLDAFEPRTKNGSRLTREQFLREMFSQEIEFIHRKKRFYYVPDRDFEDLESPIVVGRLGRQLQVKENEPPDAGLQETSRPAWHAVWVLLDPRAHDDGQKLAVRHEYKMGRPVSIVSSLVEHINRSTPEGPYVIESNAISDASDFWNFAKAHHGDITSLRFIFIAPNMFGIDDDYEKELRAMRDKERVRKAKLELENPGGLSVETERVARAVEYVSRGGGSVKARTRTRQRFDSERKVKSVSVPEAETPGISPIDLIKAAVRRIFPS